MQVAHYADIEWTANLEGVESSRGPNVGTQPRPRTLNRLLFRGTPGQPNHFEMVVATYAEPKFYQRHRHDIDQLRLTLRGVSPWAPGMETPVGSVIYIPAGTYYGPYERPGDVELMAVQFEGANALPFVDQRMLLDAQEQLKRSGSFDKGRYTWTGDDGVRHEQNGYAAAWGQATGRQQAFPDARFSLPIEINPAAFTWCDVAPGAELKELGTFGELGTRLAMFGIAAGSSFTLSPRGQTTLLFVTTGSGSADGQSLRERDGIRLEADEAVRLAADVRLELFALGLPRIDKPA